MKYNSNNKPLVCMQTQSTCYKGTSKMSIKGVLWHSTGANNPTLKRYVQPSDSKPSVDTYSKAKWLEILGKNTYGNDWNHIDREAGLNAWIGKLADGSVTSIQTMPWNSKPWGCGSGSKGSCNNGWIQFEICEDGLTNKTYFNKVYTEACELTAYLCKLYNIDPNGTVMYNGVKVPTILCHYDSHNLGLGSNHGDIYHWFKKYNKDMSTVRKDVAALLNVTESNTTTAVKTYKVVTPINKYSSADDAKAQKNAKADKLAAGTYYIYTKYPDGVNGMYNISANKTGASAGSWINPKENVLAESSTPNKIYRIRKSKDDAASQKGAFSSLENAKECCQNAGEGYHVFDWDYKIVYSYVAPVTLSSIAVTTKPKKTTYTVGESYDGTGLVVTATYSDKSTKTVVGYNVSGFSSSKAGTITVNVTFEGKATSFKVTVKEKEVVQETPKTVAVYELDFPEKTKIIDKTVKRTNADCVKAIKKIVSNNKNFDINIAKAFFSLAPKYNIDPIMAISQSILETGWFKYSGSAVTAEQHNYCGLGVTSNGVTGAAFDTVEDGVTAQLQHLFAYGCKTALPSDEAILDPRFKLVTRGIATYWQQLAGRWACPGYDTKTYDTPEKAMEAGNTYGQKILTICKTLTAVSVTNEDLEKYFPMVKEETKIEVVKKDEITDKQTSEVVVPSDNAAQDNSVSETKKPEAENTEAKKPVVKEPEITEQEKSEVDTESTEVVDEVADYVSEDSSKQLVLLIFDCLKKLVIALINLFNKGE